MIFRKLFGGNDEQAVSVSEAQQQLTAGKAHLIDVREPAEWREGHIAGATHIPLGDLAQRLETLPRDQPLLLFCRSGNRSGRATKLLQQHGFTQARNVSGGVIAWSAAHLPLERGN